MGPEFILSAISTVSSLLSSLRSTGATSADREGDGIERGLERLERLLRRIQATLYEAVDREIQDASVKLWLRELKSVAYEAEDILDEWKYELLRLQIEESGEGSSSSADERKRKRLAAAIPYRMADRIEGVIARFDEISRDREALSLREDDGERHGCVWVGSPPTSHMVNETAVFGRDEDKRRILEFLLVENRGGTNPISVTSIVGMGGVGKTILAQLVYNDRRISCYFDMTAWVYVSPKFDVTRISKDVLESISEKVYSGRMGLSTVQQGMVKAIKGKKLCLVLDDVWNELPSKWEQFLEPLQVAESVRIVVTTRNKAVSQIIRSTYIHDLSCLPQDQSNLLFEHYAFRDQWTDSLSTLREIGVQIVKKCAGLPLAIKSIGRALSSNMHEDRWTGVLESDLWECDAKDEIFSALKVSYYSLPAMLKPCFLYLSLFPKGSVIEKNEVIYMWISLGYIQSRDSKSAEALGNEFIDDLHNRSFLTKNSKRGGKEEITMHDLIHDLARSISIGDFCTNAQEIVDNESADLYCTFKEKFGMKDRSSHSCSLTRTLINKDICRNFGSANAGYISDFMGLRVLIWEVTHAHDLGHITKLKHLRYLELHQYSLRYLESPLPSEKHNSKVEYYKLKRLPVTISLLCNLVALQLSSLEYLTELPINIDKLLNLRFLSMHRVGIRELPESLGQLCKLQCLSLSSCRYLEKLPPNIGNLTNLKQLYIADLKIRELPESLCMLQKLQKLSLDGCCDLEHLPNGTGYLTNLRWLYCLGSCIKALPESITCPFNLEILQLGCSASFIATFCGFEGLLNKSSSNFFIYNGERSNFLTYRVHTVPETTINNVRRPVIRNFQTKGRFVYAKPKEEDLLIYVKTKRFIESLRPLSDLYKLEINGYQGIGYASQFFATYSPNVAIAMHCHVKSCNFFTELGDLPSLQSLSLVGVTSIQNLSFNLFRSSSPHNTKVYFPSLKELEFIDMVEWNGSIGLRDGDFPQMERLKIENCPKLTSIPNFINLRSLEIIRCSFSKLELNVLGSLVLESLLIEECIQLILLQGLKSLNSLKALCVFRCPLLSEFMYQTMQNDRLSVEIVECPSLKAWCQAQQFNYIKVYLNCPSPLNLKHQLSPNQTYICSCVHFRQKFLLFNIFSCGPGFLLQDISHFWYSFYDEERG
jgi:NB-ARC domain/Rx N-terminal domain